MAYTANYTAEDVAPAVIDGGVKIWVGIITFATVIGLGIAITWLYKIAKKLKVF